MSYESNFVIFRDFSCRMIYDPLSILSFLNQSSPNIRLEMLVNIERAHKSVNLTVAVAASVASLVRGQFCVTVPVAALVAALVRGQVVSYEEQKNGEILIF